MLGPMVGGRAPRDLANTVIHWTTTKWGCHGAEWGDDSRGIGTDGREWRHIAITLSGFAEYDGVPPKAADYFDKNLDTMCCRRCAYCSK